ncbi:hypothetical protein Tdes44962_MAKER09125, partial [Teratosphaeria destructans]
RNRARAREAHDVQTWNLEARACYIYLPVLRLHRTWEPHVNTPIMDDIMVALRDAIKRAVHTELGTMRDRVDDIEANLGKDTQALRVRQERLSQDMDSMRMNHQNRALAARVEHLARSTPVIRPAPDGRSLVLGLNPGHGLMTGDRARREALERESSMTSTATLVGGEHVSDVAIPVRGPSRAQTARKNIPSKRRRSGHGFATQDQSGRPAVDHAEQSIARGSTDQQMLDVVYGHEPSGTTGDASHQKRSRNATFVPQDGSHEFREVFTQGSVADQNNGVSLSDMKSEGDVNTAALQSSSQQSSTRPLHSPENTVRRSTESLLQGWEVDRASSLSSSPSDAQSPEAARVSHRAEALLARFQPRTGDDGEGHVQIPQESSDVTMIINKNWKSTRVRTAAKKLVLKESP